MQWGVGPAAGPKGITRKEKKKEKKKKKSSLQQEPSFQARRTRLTEPRVPHRGCDHMACSKG